MSLSLSLSSNFSDLNRSAPGIIKATVLISSVSAYLETDWRRIQKILRIQTFKPKPLVSNIQLQTFRSKPSDPNDCWGGQACSLCGYNELRPFSMQNEIRVWLPHNPKAAILHRTLDKAILNQKFLLRKNENLSNFQSTRRCRSVSHKRAPLSLRESYRAPLSLQESYRAPFSWRYLRFELPAIWRSWMLEGS